MIYSIIVRSLPHRRGRMYKIHERIMPYASRFHPSTEQPRNVGCDRHIQSSLSLPGLYSILLPYNRCYHPPWSLFTALVTLSASSSTSSSSFSGFHSTCDIKAKAISGGGCCEGRRGSATVSAGFRSHPPGGAVSDMIGCQRG